VASAAEVAPLSQRAATMMVFRFAEAAVLLALSAAAGKPLVPAAVVSGCFLVAAGVLSLGVLVPQRSFALRAFGLSLLLDAVYLQVQHETLGHALAVDVALAANLVAVCLLASFRTGLKIAMWQSVLLLVAQKAAEEGIFGAPARGTGPGDQALIADMALLWFVVVTTAVAASINERELRRRRYDAEALARLATQLHGDEHPDDVATRLVRFTVDELDASRALVCRTGLSGPVLMSGHGVSGAPAAAPADGDRPGSALLDVAAHRDGATLALRLDPSRDRWLDGHLPQARRLIALRVAASAEPVWLVLEHRATRAGRAERRMISAVTQAAATATLALSRAELLQRAERAASTDALTGVANRRTFDATLERLMLAWTAAGRPFALVLVDVDHFKSINDRFGHQVGDEALQAVARVLAGVARPDDVAARYGGEEFALLLPDTDALAAATIAEQARLALHDIDRPVRLSASFGVASVPDDASTAAAVVSAADAALIHAKNTGRDRVVLARSDARASALPRATGGLGPGTDGSRAGAVQARR
jgi:diguanylate cyclase (GGDEF)-like protein